MSHLTQKEFEKQFSQLLERIQKQATPFTSDSTSKKIARKARAKADKFFFALTYFPHYLDIPEQFKTIWKYPDEKFSPVEAGFARFHSELFRIADDLGALSIIAGFRESAKDTLVAKIDVLHKLLFEDRWFIPIIAKTEVKAETKCVPIKLELEMNERIRSDFGEQAGNVEWEFGSFITRSGRKVKGYGREQPLRGEENFGHRPDYPILNDIDDPTKPDSPALMQKFIDSVKQDILKAVNSPRWGAVLLCNYTVKGNIIDELIAGKNTAHYRKYIFRALIDNELETKEDRRIAKLCRDKGFSDRYKSAWEYRHPTLRLLKEQKDDPEVFDAEMQMHPRNRKDQKFKDTYFRYHTRDELASRNYVHYTFVDPSAKDAADYKAVITVGVAAREDGSVHIPIRRAWIQQGPIDDMIGATYRQRREFRSKLIGVETNGFQILLKREYMRLQNKYKELLPFKEIEHKGESKESRIERIVPFVKEGIITFDKDDPDQDLLIRQLKAFPNAGQVSAGGLGDDGPDALAGCVELIEVYPRAGEIGYKSLGKKTAQFSKGAW